MKEIAVCVMWLSASVAFAVDVPALPGAGFADTEVSTNFTFAVGEGSNRRLVFSLELEATPTNNVEVAIGCDAGTGAAFRQSKPRHVMPLRLTRG